MNSDLKNKNKSSIFYFCAICICVEILTLKLCKKHKRKPLICQMNVIDKFNKKMKW